MNDDPMLTQRVLNAKHCLYSATLQQLHATILMNGNVNDAIEAVQQAHLEYIMSVVHHNKTVMGQS